MGLVVLTLAAFAMAPAAALAQSDPMAGLDGYLESTAAQSEPTEAIAPDPAPSGGTPAPDPAAAAAPAQAAPPKRVPTRARSAPRELATTRTGGASGPAPTFARPVAATHPRAKEKRSARRPNGSRSARHKRERRSAVPSVLKAPFNTVSPLLRGRPAADFDGRALVLAAWALLALVAASGSLLRLTKRVARGRGL